MDFRNKRVLVLGLGLHGGGVGTVKFFARRGADITVTDVRSKKELAPSLEALRSLKGIRYVLGKHREQDVLAADLIIKNPGVPQESPYLALAAAHRVPVTSDIGIFFAECPGRIIGVTGTRGKSTTAYLIWKFLKTVYRRVFLGGNIRVSVLEFLDKTRSGDILILELSSFQLEDIAKDDLLRASAGRRSPDIAVITNILKDHLNRHRTMAAYAAAKAAIFQFQKRTDHLFINREDARVRRLVKRARSRVHFVSLPNVLKPIVERNLGTHYLSSVALACAVAKHFGVNPGSLKKILGSFRGLEGRQQTIAAWRGVQWINDTTSTVPDAAVAALKRLGAHARLRKIILIAGGQDKNLDFRAMARAIKKWAKCLVLFPGSATEKIEKELGTWSREHGTRQARSMREAVRVAALLAEPGDRVILSPGAASFGLFLNEFDRGARFIAEVARLREKGR
ncbi:MAG: UDP-N-acetylmuramoyl-L-alanine--D-glutamate ligase [Candidatus Sungbacteria bacterium]|nr:UDP-N-acetylmuramoyl-L-alanine--D-glutamate ligase [Candidatus Sungbacteria bacterium]